ncbi:hypothetical protein ACFL40_02500 [candidate division KSB1 bacterium]
MEQNNVIEEPKGGLITWLFNPFYYIAGGRALIIGLVVIILAGLIGSLTNTHFSGILDVKTGKVLPLWFDISAGLVNWIIMGVLIMIGGLIISKSRFRFVDVWGTQALSRFPTIISAFITMEPNSRRFGKLLVSQPNNLAALASENIGGLIFFILVLLITILMVIWMVYLMYRAFSVSCNVKGGKAIAIFIAVVMIGEIVSLVIFISILHKIA